MTVCKFNFRRALVWAKGGCYGTVVNPSNLVFN